MRNPTKQALDKRHRRILVSKDGKPYETGDMEICYMLTRIFFGKENKDMAAALFNVARTRRTRGYRFGGATNDGQTRGA